MIAKHVTITVNTNIVTTSGTVALHDALSMSSANGQITESSANSRIFQILDLLLLQVTPSVTGTRCKLCSGNIQALRY